MKRILKSRIFIMIITAIACIAGTAYAATVIQASQVTYNSRPLNTVLDDLYTQASARKIVCMKLSGTSEVVGAKYHCDLGESSLRNFYVLAVDNNTNEVKLIMERNITDTVGSNTTMTWDDANSFFDEGNPGYTTKQTWLTKVIDVDLPSAQDIADASGITGWDVETATGWSYFGKAYCNQSDTSGRGTYLWLWDYTRECSINGCSNSLSSSYAYGYWTKDLIQNDSSHAWDVYRDGNLSNDSVSNATIRGVRPVITVYKSNLAG